MITPLVVEVFDWVIKIIRRVQTCLTCTHVLAYFPFYRVCDSRRCVIGLKPFRSPPVASICAPITRQHIVRDYNALERFLLNRFYWVVKRKLNIFKIKTNSYWRFKTAGVIHKQVHRIYLIFRMRFIFITILLFILFFL